MVFFISLYSRGYSALRDAIDFDRHEVIVTLRNCGAHLTLEPTALGAELCMAASKGDTTRLKSFTLAGANLSQPDPCGRTALHAVRIHKKWDGNLFFDGNLTRCFIIMQYRRPSRGSRALWSTSWPTGCPQTQRATWGRVQEKLRTSWVVRSLSIY